MTVYFGQTTSKGVFCLVPKGDSYACFYYLPHSKSMTLSPLLVSEYTRKTTECYPVVCPDNLNSQELIAYIPVEMFL